MRRWFAIGIRRAQVDAEPRRDVVLAHRVFAPLKRVLPERAARRLRALTIALLTPGYFSYRNGHFRSSLRTRALDPRGEPIPWYTYPANDLLNTKNFSDRSVLEFGAGQSTLWWARRAREVLSLEGDAGWLEQLRPQISENVRLHLVASTLEDADAHVGNRSFDVIIVDGLDRHVACRKAREFVKREGVIILDNSEGYWGPEGTYPIMDFFRDQGFRRIDFYGHAPGVLLRHCTSFFFRDDCFLFKGEENPIRLER